MEWSKQLDKIHLQPRCSFLLLHMCRWRIWRSSSSYWCRSRSYGNNTPEVECKAMLVWPRLALVDIMLQVYRWCAKEVGFKDPNKTGLSKVDFLPNFTSRIIHLFLIFSHLLNFRVYGEEENGDVLLVVTLGRIECHLGDNSSDEEVNSIPVLAAKRA